MYALRAIGLLMFLLSIINPAIGTIGFVLMAVSCLGSLDTRNPAPTCKPRRRSKRR